MVRRLSCVIGLECMLIRELSQGPACPKKPAEQPSRMIPVLSCRVLSWMRTLGTGLDIGLWLLPLPPPTPCDLPSFRLYVYNLDAVDGCCACSAGHTYTRNVPLIQR